MDVKTEARSPLPSISASSGPYLDIVIDRWSHWYWSRTTLCVHRNNLYFLAAQCCMPGITSICKLWG